MQRERGALGGHLERGRKDDRSDGRRYDPMSHIGNLKEPNLKCGWGVRYPPTHHAFVRGSAWSGRPCVDLEDKILYFHGWLFPFPGCKVL